jgi:TetR/AcrR family transcriptional repressor of multidrug resistance operon
MRTRDEKKIEALYLKAIEISVEKGFEGLSMQKLAKAANVSPATIYIYFKDREDLILKISIKAAEKMIAATLKDFNHDMSFKEGLKIQWKNRSTFWLKNPLEAKFIEMVRHSHIGDTVFQMVKKEFSSVLGEFVHKAIKRKELVDLPLEVYWSIAFSPLYTLIKFHNDGHSIAGKKFEWSDDYMKQAFKLEVKALSPK